MDAEQFFENAGIIPACAGNTSPRPARTPTTRDHPRVCGEHGYLTTAEVAELGSSPRVRGTLPRSAWNATCWWIIPACAGNTILISGATGQHGDHPRVCGEHLPLVKRISCWPGSSPRVRGTRLDVERHQVRAGIIPACAGNTVWEVHSCLVGGDHPRVCGEHGGIHCLRLNE